MGDLKCFRYVWEAAGRIHEQAVAEVLALSQVVGEGCGGVLCCCVCSKHFCCLAFTPAQSNLFCGVNTNSREQCWGGLVSTLQSRRQQSSFSGVLVHISLARQGNGGSYRS